MKQGNAEPSLLLVEHLPVLKSVLNESCSSEGRNCGGQIYEGRSNVALPDKESSVEAPGPNRVLDLACGSGRNGLYLLKHNIPIVFADNNPAALESVADKVSSLGKQADLWQVDFEQGSDQVLTDKLFDAIVVCNYLHRPLIPDIRQSIRPGGLLIYETFTRDQAALGRPSNPDYLLQAGELKSWFQDWEIVHSFEGRMDNPLRAIANLVARRPHRE